MTEEMILVPRQVLKMITSDGFLEYYHSIKKRHMTMVDAYEQCEEIYAKYFGQRKYSEFQSFYINKRRKNK